ncbi:MAG: DUF2141 domain-containing protein [Flavobacteriales bacterium]
MRHVIIAALLATPALAEAQASLAIEFVLTKPVAGGLLRVALCPGAGAYAKEQGCMTRTVEANGASVQVGFGDLAPGRYAIKAYHDINGNGRLDTNWMGMPKEPYGFGNDAMGAFGPPSYEQAAVPVEGRTAVTVRMKD